MREHHLLIWHCRLVPRSHKDPGSRICKIQDSGSWRILDPALQVLPKDPGDLGSWLLILLRDPGDLGFWLVILSRDPGSWLLILSVDPVDMIPHSTDNANIFKINRNVQNLTSFQNLIFVSISCTFEAKTWIYHYSDFIVDNRHTWRWYALKTRYLWEGRVRSAK